MNQKLPRVYDYTDFREYLRDVYQARKKVDRRFSQRYIARSVGASSSGWFSDIINGRIPLTATYHRALVTLLGLRPREADFFELLVQYGQTTNLEDKNRYLGKLLAFKDVQPLVVSRQKFDFYRYWYYTAIRELLIYSDFCGDYAALTALLEPGIRPAEARQAIDTLEAIGLIRKDEKGCYRPVDRTISKDSTFQSVHWRNFVTSMMKLAIESVDRFAAEDRNISSVTVGLSESGWKIACNEVALLRKRLLALSERDTNPEKIVQCNFQLFPLTKNMKDTP